MTCNSWIDNAARVFGIKIFDQRGGIFDVGKQRGDGLAFSVRRATRFQCHLLGQNPFRKMSRGVAHWGPRVRSRFPFRRLFSRQGRTAFAAKFGLRQILYSTCRALVFERRSTLNAELHSRGIVKLATWAMHRNSLC